MSLAYTPSSVPVPSRIPSSQPAPAAAVRSGKVLAFPEAARVTTKSPESVEVPIHEQNLSAGEIVQRVSVIRRRLGRLKKKVQPVEARIDRLYSAVAGKEQPRDAKGEQISLVAARAELALLRIRVNPLRRRISDLKDREEQLLTHPNCTIGQHRKPKGPQGASLRNARRERRRPHTTREKYELVENRRFKAAEREALLNGGTPVEAGFNLAAYEEGVRVAMRDERIARDALLTAEKDRRAGIVLTAREWTGDFAESMARKYDPFYSTMDNQDTAGPWDDIEEPAGRGATSRQRIKEKILRRTEQRAEA